ncbi:response regulator [Caenimonas sedimenti]|nr:response regulator [Caenimonas sedimenti]
MRVRFWGTRGSIATPGPGTTHFGGNTSCVEITTDAGDLLVLDCGTGAHPLATALMARARKPIHANILLGHTHWDHIQGFPFFSPAFVKGNTVAIHGPEGSHGSLHKVLAGQMEFTYFPVELNQLPAAITYHDLAEGIHTIGNVRVAAQFLNHPAQTLGYRIEADGAVVVYLVDHEPFSSELWRAGEQPGRIESILHDGDRRHARFMADADLVIHDAQYTREEYEAKKTWGHSSYDYPVQLAAAAGVRRLALTHHDPSHDDGFVAEIEAQARALAATLGKEIEVFCAYEGWEMNIEPRAAPRSFVTSEASQPSAAQRSFEILVVDDDPDTLALIVRALEADYTVTQASSGAQALQMLTGSIPDMMVVDYKMAEMDGMTLVRTLRAQPKTEHLPVLMLTGMADEASTRAGFDAGVTDYVTKPFSIPQLTARVHACLARMPAR